MNEERGRKNFVICIILEVLVYFLLDSKAQDILSIMAYKTKSSFPLGITTILKWKVDIVDSKKVTRFKSNYPAFLLTFKAHPSCNFYCYSP